MQLSDVVCNYNNNYNPAVVIDGSPHTYGTTGVAQKYNLNRAHYKCKNFPVNSKYPLLLMYITVGKFTHFWLELCLCLCWISVLIRAILLFFVKSKHSPVFMYSNWLSCRFDWWRVRATLETLPTLLYICITTELKAYTQWFYIPLRLSPSI